MKNVLLVSNLIFLKLDTNTSFGTNTDPLYIAGSVSGNLFLGSIHPYSVIQSRYSDIKEFDDLLDIEKIYKS